MIRDDESMPAELKVMAIVVTVFDSDLIGYINYYRKKSPRMYEDIDWIQSLIKKVVGTKCNIMYTNHVQ